MEFAKGRETMLDDLDNSKKPRSKSTNKKKSNGKPSSKVRKVSSNNVNTKRNSTQKSSSTNRPMSSKGKATSKGKAASKRKKRKKKIAFRIGITLLLLLILIVAVVSTIFVKTVNSMDIVNLDKNNLGITDSSELSKFNNYDKIKNILLFGVDSRTEGGSGRSDSIMLVTIDPIHNKLKVTSFMRDSRVSIDGYGEDKLNHAYAFGGPELAIKTINKNFGLNVKDFATVDFATLPKVIDSVGGIEIEITNEELPELNRLISSQNTLNNLNTALIPSAGLHTLSGYQVLAYSRNRNSSGGDYMRTQRQRVIIEALFKKGLSTSPTKYPKILNSVLPLITTNMKSNDILSLAKTVFSLGNGTIEQCRFPLDDYSWGDYADNNLWYLFFDRETTKNQVQEYIFDDISPTN